MIYNAYIRTIKPREGVHIQFPPTISRPSSFKGDATNRLTRSSCTPSPRNPIGGIDIDCDPWLAPVANWPSRGVEQHLDPLPALFASLLVAYEWLVRIEYGYARHVLWPCRDTAKRKRNCRDKWHSVEPVKDQSGRSAILADPEVRYLPISKLRSSWVTPRHWDGMVDRST